MSGFDFSSRLARLPLAFDPARGAEARAALPGLTPALGDLVAGAAGSSPYLAGLVGREAGWLAEALDGSPEQALSDCLGALGGEPAERLPEALRQAKRRVALVAALADLGGVWPLERVTGALTALADRAVDVGLRALVAAEIRRGKIPGIARGDEGDPAGLFALAMGKMGAGELNYSSDIDLIFLYDDDRFDPADRPEARAAFIRVVRRLTGWLSDVTAGGYVFRTDLRLRPDASVTPVVIATGAAEQYYEAEGRSWERAAHIKARPCAGDLAAGARYLARLTPFVWRRHLDFAAIRDVHDLRLKIRDHKGLGGPIVLDGHDMKLGRGGIREIEFFTQTRQLIAGGRDPGLRDRTTLGGLAALAARGWIPQDVATRLAAHYRAHRETEHRLQMVNDAQTHSLPTAPDAFDKLARLSGEADTARWREAILGRLREVESLTEPFFDPEATPCAPAPAGPVPEGAAEVTRRWPSYPALRSERARQIFRALEPELLGRLGRAADPTDALRQFDGFLAGLPAGVQLFSMFRANPSLIELIVDICATAPSLARYLSRNARVLDAVIGGGFFAPWPGQGALASELAAQISGLADYEAALDRARVWQREWHFRIGVHNLRGLIDADEAGAQYADLAGAVLNALWPRVTAEIARRHGPPPGRGAAIVGMGSLGIGRLNAASDLDLIVIYDAAGQEASTGERPLAARAYYARLTQALVTALSASMAEGRLYEVDMRLRPSGRQGPVATSIAAFESYQMTEAWTWEHLALTRARVMAGPPPLAEAIETIRRRVLAAKAANPAIAADTQAMRDRIFAARGRDGARDGGGVKTGAGRLQDIELFAQSLALRTADPARALAGQLRAGRRAGLIAPDEEAALNAAGRLLWRMRAATRLVAGERIEPGEAGEGARAVLLRETGTRDLADLDAGLSSRTAEAAAIIDRRLAADAARAGQGTGDGAAEGSADGGADEGAEHGTG
ncbi:glutamine-synthetase adenylyltransferase [Frigidibacter sp. MR17.24]|uniref:[protein-PII] uridylyltransferase family protein n=1 Tax=Frigidibacter sp. MR17.24 TaxID=3127345 RepID=UPI003012B1E9